MTFLTHSEVLLITRGAVLINHASDAISEFEQQLIVDIGQRFIRHGRTAVITPLERPVLEAAVEAMSAAVRVPQVQRVAA